MIQYGGPIRDGKGDLYGIVRDGKTVLLQLETQGHMPSPIMRLVGYPALLQLIARLQEAAKDMAGVKA